MLLQLWEHRDRNRVTYAAYRQLGGGRGALAYSADEFYNSLITEDQETAKRILLKMVRPSTGLEVTNNRILQQELYQLGIDPGRINRVLDRLCATRLVRRTTGATPDDTQIEVAHEALIRNWPRLIEWLDEERVALRQRLHLADTAKEWEIRGYPKEMLLKGKFIEEAQRYNDLNNLESKFVGFSQRESQRRSRNKTIAIGSIIGALAITNMALFWTNQKLDTKSEELTKINNELAAKNEKIEARNATLEALQNKNDILQTTVIDQQEEAKQQGIVLNPEIIVNPNSASENEMAGFQALLDGNLSQAGVYFGQAYAAFPTYHNVDEINRLIQANLDDFNQADATKREDILHQMYKSILDSYSWGAPPEVLAQMQTRLSATVE